MADEMMGLRCRNCGNTGISPWTGKPCGCRYGKAAKALLNAAQPVINPQVVAAVADKHEQRQQQPVKEPRAIVRHFAAAMERKLAANEHKPGWKRDNWTSHYAGLGIEKDELLDALTKRQKVLMALDGLTVEWENGQLLSQVDAKEGELLRLLDEANNAVLMEAADCANYLAMLCDVCGALPPTDERGREP